MYSFIKRIIFIVFLVSFSVNSLAQLSKEQLIDSLKFELKKAIQDTTRIKLMNTLSHEFANKNSDSGIYYANNALQIAEKLHWEKGIALAHRNLGSNYVIKSDYPNALNCFFKSLSLYTKLNDKLNSAVVLNYLGLFYVEQHKEVEGISYFNKSININKSIDNNKGLSRNYVDMGMAFSSLKNYQKAEEYYNKALIIKEKVKDQHGIVLVLLNQAADQIELNNLCKATQLTLKVKTICDQQKMIYNSAFCYSYLGEIFFNRAKDSTSKKYECNYFYKNNTQNLQKAKEYTFKSLTMFEKINDLHAISYSFKMLFEIHEDLGDYKLALENYKKHIQYKDSVFSKDNSIKIANIEKQNEIDLRNEQLKEHERVIHKKQDQMIFLIGFLVLGVVFVSFYVYAHRKRQKVEHILNKQLATKNLELEKINRTKDKFFSIISHDLRSPFNSLIGISELLVTDFDKYEKDRIKRLVQALHKTAIQAHKLLENLLEWSRLQRNAIVVNFETANLNTMAEEVISMARSMAESKNVLLENRVNKEVTAYCDLQMTKAILRNLISNAIKFTTHGTITVDAIKNEAFTEIKVIDTGVGIPKDILSKLFEIDGGISTSGTNNEKGTGLGLIICKELVEKQGGKIWVESAVGKGSAFIFTLPIPKK